MVPERRDEGMVSAELAVAIPAVLVVLACCLSGLGLAVDQVRCVDAARVAARAASRGDTREAVVELALDRSPEGSTVDVNEHGRGVVRVVVTAPARLMVVSLPPASATAFAVPEPGLP